MRRLISGVGLTAAVLGAMAALRSANDQGSTGSVAVARDRGAPALRSNPDSPDERGADDQGEAERDPVEAERSDDAPRALARTAGRSSGFLARLPADDQAWVLTESAAALTRGQIEPSQLAAYVDQLASVREFAVIERTAPYLNPESYR